MLNKKLTISELRRRIKNSNLKNSQLSPQKFGSEFYLATNLLNKEVSEKNLNIFLSNNLDLEKYDLEVPSYVGSNFIEIGIRYKI